MDRVKAGLALLIVLLAAMLPLCACAVEACCLSRTNAPELSALMPCCSEVAASGSSTADATPAAFFMAATPLTAAETTLSGAPAVRATHVPAAAHPAQTSPPFFLLTAQLLI